VRTVGVKLEAETAGFKRDMGSAAKATTDVDRGLDKLVETGLRAKRSLDDVGDGAGSAGRNVDGLKRDLGRLDRQIITTTAELKLLGREFARTGDVDIGKAFRKKSSELRQLGNVRKALGDVGGNAATDVRKMFGKAGAESATAFGSEFSKSLPRVLQPLASPLGLVLGGAAIAAAPVIGATISAAVIGGAGIGGVVGGMTLAARDERVKAAGSMLGQVMLADLETRAQRQFVTPMLDSIGRVQRGFNAMDGDLDRIFKNSSRLLVPLTGGTIAFAQRVTAGIAGLTDAAGPVVDVISRGVADLGGTIREVFSSLKDNGVDAAVALNLVFKSVDNTIRAVGVGLNVLTESFGFLAKVGAFGHDAQVEYILLEANARVAAAANRDAARSFMPVREQARTAAAGMRGMVTQALRLAGPVGASALAADAHTRAMRGEIGAMSELNSALRSQIDPLFAFTEAQKQVKTAQDRATAAVREHGRNSVQAREATRNLASAALDLQARAGTLAQGFDGKLTPSMKATFKAAGLTKQQISDVEGQLKTAKTAADKYDGKYAADVSIKGAPKVAAALKSLGDMQKALKTGTAPPGGWNIASGALVKAINDPKLRASGGPITGPGGPRDDAVPAMLSNGEYVHQASAVSYYGQGAMGAINNRQVPKEALAAFAAYKNGGAVGWPYPVTAAMTRIPSKAEAMSAVTPAFSGGGPTLDFIIRAVHSRFPGMRLISGYRPGARTLSGNVSYHALHRAADWPASLDLAKWWNANYMRQTKEFISPWNSLNIHNGARHAYTGAIYRQHSGANAHDHIAMAGGGVINEPVYGIGASGRSYSFAENGRPETVIPGAHASAGTTYAPTYHITVPVGPGVHPAEAGRAVVGAIQAYEKNNGRTWRNAP
jgi:hypothetical protein